MKCLNRDTLEYQTLKNMSGVSEFVLDSSIRYYLDKYNRYPEIDEIPGADSSKNLKDVLKIKYEEDHGYLEIANLLQFTNKDTVEEAKHYINNVYKDCVVTITEMDDKALIRINKRPSQYGYLDINKSDTNFKVGKINNPKAAIREALNKLQTNYGIKVQYDLDIDQHGHKGSIQNGIIHIIEGEEDLEIPVHELLHIFLGAMKFTDPYFYKTIVSMAESLGNLNYISKNYAGRTYTDILEEAFIAEYAKYVVGKEKNLIESLPIEIISKIDYHVKRNLDSFLNGNYSVSGWDFSNVMQSTLKELTEFTESNLVQEFVPNATNLAALNRKIANFKQTLIEDNKLKEICE